MSDYQYKFGIGHEFTFTSPYDQYIERIGQHAVVVSEVARSEDYEEIGSLFWIRFDDGSEIEAWPEEIDPSEIVGEEAH